MKKADAYKMFFSKDYLMGPNSVRLLEEMLEKYPLEKGMRVLDLGWISATENHTRFNEWQISDKVIPLHADANDLPFAESYFDAVVSIDSFHYFAEQPHFFEQKILPLLKPKGVAIIAMPGLKEEIHGKEPEVILEWLDGEESEYSLYHCRDWWLKQIGQSDDFKVLMDFDLESFDEAWQDWFLSRHEFALHDEEFFQKGVAQYLSTVGLVIQKV